MAVNTTQSIFTEIADFLVPQPDLKALADYHVSPPIQAYIDSLLDKNSEQGLTADERLELEKILAVSHIMTLAKTKAKLRLLA